MTSLKKKFAIYINLYNIVQHVWLIVHLFVALILFFWGTNAYKLRSAHSFSPDENNARARAHISLGEILKYKLCLSNRYLASRVTQGNHPICQCVKAQQTSNMHTYIYMSN